MAEELEKTCRNCEYEKEDIEGKHCKSCAESKVDNFVSKETAKEIRAKAIDECIKIIEETPWKDIDMLVESIRQLKGGANSIG